MHEIAKLQEPTQRHRLSGTGNAVHGLRHLHQGLFLPNHIETVIDNEEMAQQLIHAMGFFPVLTVRNQVVFHFSGKAVIILGQHLQSTAHILPMENVIHGLLPAAFGRCGQQFMELLHHRQVQLQHPQPLLIGIGGLQGRRCPAAGVIFQKDGYILPVVEKKGCRRIADDIGQSQLFIERILQRRFHSQMTMEAVPVAFLIGQRLSVVPTLDFLAAHAL